MTRDEIALSVLPQLHRDFQDCVRNGECDCPPNWRREIAKDAYKLADAFLQERAHQSTETHLPKLPTTEYRGGPL